MLVKLWNQNIKTRVAISEETSNKSAKDLIWFLNLLAQLLLNANINVDRLASSCRQPLLVQLYARPEEESSIKNKEGVNLENFI